MTDAEAFLEIAKDKDNINKWMEAHMNAFRRAVLKTRQLPYFAWVEYRSPRNNKYLILTQATTRKIEKSGEFAFIAIRNGKDGLDALIFGTSRYTKVKPVVLTNHALRRYAERTGMPEGTGVTESLKDYMKGICDGLVLSNREAMGKSVRYKDEDYIGLCTQKGIWLGKRNGPIFVVKTFITYDMTAGIQKEEAERSVQKLNKIHENPVIFEELQSYGVLQH